MLRPLWGCRLPVMLRRQPSTLRTICHTRVPRNLPNRKPKATAALSLLERVPSNLRPYLYLARLDKPIGTLLLFYPCAWSITMAAYSIHAPIHIPAMYIALFGTGAFIMRGAGCTINDLWDRNLDRAVARTKDRPLASRSLSPRQAIGFLAAQLSAGLAILLQLNWYSIALGASSLAFVAVYPLMKRITHWPQAVLGLTFNWGALLGWSAVAGSVDWAVSLPLYVGGVAWTLVYDTIYAHQDKEDDVKVGIKSTALLFGERTAPILTGMACASIGSIGYAAYMNNQGPLFYAGLMFAGLQLARILREVDYSSRSSCWKAFVRCGTVGLIVWGAATVDYISTLTSNGT